MAILEYNGLKYFWEKIDSILQKKIEGVKITHTTNPSQVYYYPIMTIEENGDPPTDKTLSNFYADNILQCFVSPPLLTGANHSVEFGIGNNLTGENGATGALYLYGSGSGYTYLKTLNTSEKNYTINMPAKSGTLALLDEVLNLEAGGIIKGDLKVKNSNFYPYINFQISSIEEDSYNASLFYYAPENSSISNFQFQYGSRNQDGTYTNFFEYYLLPQATEALEDNYTYNILTTKNYFAFEKKEDYKGFLIASQNELLGVCVGRTFSEENCAAIFSDFLIRPGANNIISLGSENFNWHSIFASTVYGNLEGAITTFLEEPINATYYYPILASDKTDKKVSNPKVNPGLAFYTMNGTETNKGLAELGIGNFITKGTIGNLSGAIYLYGEGKGYTYLKPSNNSNINYTLYLPSENGILISGDNNGNVPINKGGTGATNAIQARNNLGIIVDSNTPTSPFEGLIWIDTSSSALKYYINGSWEIIIKNI